MIWFLALLISGLLIKKRKAKKVFIITAFCVFYVFSNKFLMNKTINLWQTKPTEITELKSSYDYGIVLGGFSSYEEKTDVVSFHESIDRMMFALKMYYEGRIQKIVISSDSAALIDDKYKEADFVKQFLISLNIPEEDIITENQSKNTYKTQNLLLNCLEIRKILQVFC